MKVDKFCSTVVFVLLHTTQIQQIAHLFINFQLFMNLFFHNTYCDNICLQTLLKAFFQYKLNKTDSKLRLQRAYFTSSLAGEDPSQVWGHGVGTPPTANRRKAKI